MKQVPPYYLSWCDIQAGVATESRTPSDSTLEGRAHPSRRRVWRYICLLTVSAAVALGQQPETPDPLTQLLRSAPPQNGQVALHIAVLKVPVAVAARASLADDGRSPAYWRDTLMTWGKAGLLQSVTEKSLAGAPGQALQQKDFPFRYIAQDSASHFWDQMREWEAWGGDPPDAKSLLQEMQEQEVGTSVAATVNVYPAGGPAWMDISLRVCPPEPESRPTPAWPLPFLSAPRYFFRPWSLQTTVQAPLDQIFLLGAQMEPPRDGQVHTGHVSMAFARLSYAPAGQATPPENATGTRPGQRVQTWTVAVPLRTFQEWLLTRKDDAGDEARLNTWVGAGASGEPVEILATSILATTTNSAAAHVSSALLWHDARGYEPSGNPLIFSPLSCDGDEEYRLSHDLEVSLSQEQEGADAAAQDPFAPATPGVSLPRTGKIAIEVTVNRPAAAARWVRCKTAFESTEAGDPQALEIAEADPGKHEGVTTRMFVSPGRVSLLGACLKGERVHASFLRFVEETPDPVAVPPAATPSMTTWIFETPLSWRDRLLAGNGPDLRALAGELLAGTGKGDVECVGLLHATVTDLAQSTTRSMRPRLFFGGNYLNSAVHARGIYFNPRNVEFLPQGELVETELSGTNVAWNLHSTGEPQTRHWGIWQPDILTATARNSGMPLPTQAVCDLQVHLRLRPHQPEVVAVVQTSDLGAAQPANRKLRWHVARIDPASSADETPAESRTAQAETVQAIILKPAADLVLPKDPQAAADILLRAAREGKAETLDCVTLARSHRSDRASLKLGWNYYFTDGRARVEGSKPEDAFHAPAAMPPGTAFAEQIDINNRVVGYELQIGDSDWTLSRDAEAPEIVTDTFSDVRLEWPAADPNTADSPVPPARTRVSVQRPVFNIREYRGPVPEAGQTSVTALADNTVLLLRILR